MTKHEFLNALKILRAIDRHELEEAGVQCWEITWRHFRDNPYEFLIHADDPTADAIWSIIERRQAQ